MAAPAILAPAAPGSTVELPPWSGRDFAVPSIFLALLTVAELLTAAVDVRVGMPAHAALLATLVVLGATTTDSAKRELYWTLTLAPIIRLGSLSLPLARLPLLAWYPLIGVPIFVGCFVAARKLGYRPAHIGLTVNIADLPRQLALIPLGAVLGIGEYFIFRPAPLVASFSVPDIALAGFILLVFTGFEEELIFRGLMQRAALRSLGRWGIVYVSGVFAVLHIGYLSVADVIFVFLVGLLFAAFALKTKSIFGVTLAHGAVNISLFLILPFLAPIVVGSGYADLLPLPAPPTP